MSETDTLESGSREIDVSVVVPVYGGEQTIARLFEGFASVAAQQGWRFEVIFVCDRPRDDSWRVARALACEHDCVRAVLLRRNFGQHPATLLGIRMARGRTVVTMDEDLQHDPGDIPTLVERSRQINGVVYGLSASPQHARRRNVASWLAKWFLARYVGIETARDISAFRAFPTELRHAFAHYRGERVAIDVLLSWSGAAHLSIPCQHAPRQAGHSGYTFRKLVAYLSDLLLGFSIAPLRLASLMGIAAVLLSIAIAAFVLIRWLIEGSQVPGFAFLALSVSLFAGVQLLALGVMGEYLGRLYFNNLGRPQYLVEEVVEQVDDRSAAAPP